MGSLARSIVIDAVLFDLGNTLVRYFLRDEFPTILAEAIGGVQAYLDREGLRCVSPEVVWQGVKAEDYEAADHRLRPLEGRLVRIFGLDPDLPAGTMAAACRAFLAPVFARARRYDDAWPTLEALRAAGYRTAIVSNLPWGSPAAPWVEEVARQGLAERTDAVVFCADVGWRKPAWPIFEAALERLGARPQACLFVGDNPRWDLAGPRALGMEAVLIDRHGAVDSLGETPIRSLDELRDRLIPRR
jgi:putative hydrolase of the HAD superfamily